MPCELAGDEVCPPMPPTTASTELHPSPPLRGRGARVRAPRVACFCRSCQGSLKHRLPTPQKHADVILRRQSSPDRRAPESMLCGGPTVHRTCPTRKDTTRPPFTSRPRPGAAKLFDVEPVRPDPTSTLIGTVSAPPTPASFPGPSSPSHPASEASNKARQNLQQRRVKRSLP